MALEKNIMLQLYRAHFCLVFLLCVPITFAAMEGFGEVTADGKSAIATVNPLATSAGLEVYAKGGNAIDAAVAAALALGVVDGHNSGIGGGSFILIHWANGKIEAIDAREVAPAKAHRNMYVEGGKVNAQLSRVGALASGIPGSVAAFDYLLGKGGKLTRQQIFSPSIVLAEKGFPIDAIYARRLQRHAEVLRSFTGSASVLLDENKQPWPAQHVLVQEDLAKTYKALAEKGADYFYKGDFANKVGQWMVKNKGVIEASDFSNYQLLIREPVRSSYRGFDIFGFPPPSSGGIHVAQILNILKNYDVASLKDSDRQHVLAEAMKLAFADRAYWLGDPAFAKVPANLVSNAYAKKLAKKISLKHAANNVEYGTPANADIDLFDKHTTHISTADSAGNWVAITTTVNTDFGSKVIIPGTGVIMNNQMDDFSAEPGVPNLYGLVGSEANSVAPGKRPLSSMSPTIVLQNGKPIMTLGAAGGPTIISQVVQALIQVIDNKSPLQEALSAPRIHHQWRPDALYLEPSIDEAIKAELSARGHTIKKLGPYGSTQAISIDKDGKFTAVAEPRLEARTRL